MGAVLPPFWSQGMVTQLVTMECVTGQCQLQLIYEISYRIILYLFEIRGNVRSREMPAALRTFKGLFFSMTAKMTL